MKRMATLLFGVILSVAGYNIGSGISVWAARIHPVNEWKSWYNGSNRKVNLRRELVPDTPGAIRLVGISSTDRLWDANLSKEGLELTKDQIYRCRCRLRGKSNSSVLLNVFDSAPPHTNRGLESCFTPTPSWQDYDFTFRANETGKAIISMFIGSRAIDVEVAYIDVQPVHGAEQNGAEIDSTRHDSVFQSLDNWSMVPAVSSGSMLVKEIGKGPLWSFHRSPKRVDGAAVESLSFRVPMMPLSDKLLLQISLAGENTDEVEIWFVSRNGEVSARTIAPIDRSAVATRIPIHLATPTDAGTIFIQSSARTYDLEIWQMELRSLSGAAAPLDCRYFQLVKDDGVVARIKQGTDADSPTEIITSGSSEKIVRLEHPVAVKGGVPSTITLDVQSAQKKSMRLVVAQNHEPWESIGDPVDVPIETEWKSVKLPFRATVDEPNARLVISFDDGPGAVHLKKLRMNHSKTP